MNQDPGTRPEQNSDPLSISRLPSDEEESFSAPAPEIEGYQILEKLGEAGQGQVWRAVQLSTGRQVALKVPRIGLLSSKRTLARFEREVEIAARLRHPNIARIYDSGVHHGLYFYVMDLVEGKHLDQYVKENALSQRQMLELMKVVCEAVQHAHQNGVIHRDLKPSNIIVTEDGRPYIVDFGLAKLLQNDGPAITVSLDGETGGTPAYMSPEQAAGRAEQVDTRTDVYSLGAILFTLLTGRHPHDLSGSHLDVLLRITEGEVIQPRRLNRAMDRDLEALVLKALEHDADRRYSSAGGLAEDIQRHLRHEPVQARGPNPVYRLQKLLRRHRALVLALLAIGLVSSVAAIILTLWNRDRLQLAEAEGFRHRSILSQAREHYAKADRLAALKTVEPILHSRHVGPEAQLLYAGILVDGRYGDDAVTTLKRLLHERPAVAGAAHALLARVFWESETTKNEKVLEIEEHRRQAEALLPETAEAYFLRAMTAITIKEQLAFLDRALQLDPSHYESCRLRAFTYYASRKYEKMKDDALAMVVLRPRDPLGYSLRAIAGRELGRYTDAISDYDRAMALMPQEDPQHVELSIQRCETLLRMGDYEQVIAEARKDLQSAPDKTIYEYHTFCALVALGRYHEADSLFREMTCRSPASRTEFEHWMMKYVFDSFEAQRPWHPPDRAPAGAAFQAMWEAQETYRNLSAKGRRLTTAGFRTCWSPDGKKLAFSLGFHGYSGVAIFDPATRETELLIVPGKDARWSPDGRYIAFVRDCQMLRLPEFTAAERKSQHRAPEDEEIWIMNADATEPRRLVMGSSPYWSLDSTHIYFHSRVHNTLCSIAVDGQGTEPKQIMESSKSLPYVSPDNRLVAGFKEGVLRIVDLSSQEPVAECAVPSLAWGNTTWSPTGNEICVAGSNPEREKTGLWIYDLSQGTLLRVLDGQFGSASWSPNGTDLAFCLCAPYWEVWTATLDPNISTAESLGLGRTPDEHLREMVAFYTRRIEADPLDAYAYSRRAQHYDRLHERDNACADMRRWSAVISQESAPDLSTTPAQTDVTFGEPVDLETIIPVLNHETDVIDCFSLDDLEMYITSNRPEGSGDYDLWVLQRASKDDAWGAPVNLGPAVNCSKEDSLSFISPDGLALYFGSNRPSGHGSFDIYMTTRPNRNSPWVQAVNLGPRINSSAVDGEPWISPDGLEFYFESYRSGGYGSSDIYVAKRKAVNEPWGDPVNLGPVVNSPYSDQWHSLSPDGLLLLFNDHPNATAFRPGGYGRSDMWMTSRASLSEPWQPPVNLGPTINSPAHDGEPRISPDGRTLYFMSNRSGTWRNYQVPIVPVGDFDSNAAADAKDMAVLADN